MKGQVCGRCFWQRKFRHGLTSVLSFFSKQESGSYLAWRDESRSESEQSAVRKDEGYRGNSRSVTLGRPEAVVNYARAG